MTIAWIVLEQRYPRGCNYVNKARKPRGRTECKIYYQDDTLALIEAMPERYNLKGAFKLPKRPCMSGPGWAHPVIADGKLYIRHADVLMCFDVKAK